MYFQSIGQPSQYLCVTQRTLILYCGQFRTIEYYKALNLTHNISEFIDYAKNDIYAERIKKANIIFLCLVAQYLDSLNCFQDEFRPK